MIVNYLGQSSFIASPPPLLSLCYQTPTWFLKGNDSATSVTLGLQSHFGLECGCLSYGIFARQCQGFNQFLQLHVVHCWHVINNASQRLGEGEGETLTMQRPLNCTFHDTARTKVWCSLQRRRRQTGRKIHCVATPPPTPYFELS